MRISPSLPSPLAASSITLLLASSGMAAVHTSSGIAVSIGVNSVDTGTWDIDGSFIQIDIGLFASATTMLLTAGQTNYTQTPWSGRAYAHVSMSASGVQFARGTGGGLALLTSSVAISAAAFSNPVSGAGGQYYAVVTGFLDSNQARYAAAASAASQAMWNAFGDASGYRFIGFRFDNGEGGYNYGWATLTWEASGASMSIMLLNPTWSDLDGIYTGTTTEIGAVPEPAHAATGLGALALGAVGLARWRRNRKAA